MDLRAEITKLKSENMRLKKERRQMADRVAASMSLTSIGQLAAGVAHELNNPLSVILGFAQSLATHFSHEEAVRSSLKTMEREALRCRRLVQELLMFSRLPKPGKAMEDISHILEGALPLVETQARIRRVDVIQDMASGLPALHADKHRIQQLVINLCTNAMDAMPTGGQLRVGARLAVDGGKTPWIELSVSDTGTGIAPEIRDRIFEPFFTTKDPGKGTGLGLSLVDEIVKEHDGRVEVVSEKDRGTTFTIRLPIGVRPVRTASAQAGTPRQNVLD